MDKSIANKTVIVTGGASGIGLSIVEYCIKNGAKIVIIIDINEELGNKVVSYLKEQNGTDIVDFYKCDVTTDLEKIFNCISKKYTQIDLLVNSAGIADENIVKRTININVTSLIEWSFKFYDFMRKDRNGNGGTIINVASIYGLRIAPYIPTYHASKFAVIGFSKSLGHEYNFKKSGVRVLAVCPGFTYTPLTEDIRTRDDSVREDFKKVMSRQDVSDVGKGVIEVFEKADSGSVWVIEGSHPPAMV